MLTFLDDLAATTLSSPPQKQEHLEVTRNFGSLGSDLNLLLAIRSRIILFRFSSGSSSIKTSLVSLSKTADTLTETVRSTLDSKLAHSWQMTWSLLGISFGISSKPISKDVILVILKFSQQDNCLFLSDWLQGSVAQYVLEDYQE